MITQLADTIKHLAADIRALPTTIGDACDRLVIRLHPAEAFEGHDGTPVAVCLRCKSEYPCAETIDALDRIAAHLDLGRAGAMVTTRHAAR